MLVTPNGWGGNFFNRYTRTGYQGEAKRVTSIPISSGTANMS